MNSNKKLTRRAHARWLFPALLALLLTACGGNGPNAGTAAVKLIKVTATSSTSLKVVFSGVVDAGAENPANYTVASAAGKELAVQAAYLGENHAVVNLATAEQAPGERYVLSVHNIMSAGGHKVTQPLDADDEFSGSSVKAPVLAFAIALSHTEVMLTFVDSHDRPVALRDTAENAIYYHISPSLEVKKAELATGKDHGQGHFSNVVILTTAPQENRTYTVQATNLEDVSGRLIDYNHDEASFTGIPENDETPPTVTAAATTNTTVLVRFSEPVGKEAGDATHYQITDASGATLTVTAAVLNAFGTQATLTTAGQTQGMLYTLQVSGIKDLAGNLITAAGGSASFTGRSVSENPNALPEVSGAGATDSTHVVVTFTKPMRGGMESAENPKHYRISTTSPDGASGQSLATQSVVAVLEAEQIAPTAVKLTTLPQAGKRYYLKVTDVVDTAGNQLAPKRRGYDPSVTSFVGIPPSGPFTDSDGDGLSDFFEEKGWTVTITETGGQTSQSQVTSDPFNPDTDGDGLGDATEAALGANPRSGDSDGDGLGDYQEFNYTYSDPTNQDTDGDGIYDGLEFNFYHTSPLRADTDGDQFSDDEEVVNANRNPVIADLPRLKISIGDVNLALDERYSYTDTQGKSQTLETSSSTTLEQGTDRTFSTSDTNTTASALKFGQSLKVSAGYKFPGGSVSVTAGATSEEDSSQEYTSSVSQASAQHSNKAYNDSVSKGSSIQSSSAVTRQITGASVQLPLTLGSISDVAFSVTNLEVTALWQDPVDSTRLVPVATLVPATEIDASGNPTGNVPTYNLGPFVPSVGPLVFASRKVFPKTVEQLMKAPRGLIFKVANYDILDEAGRNFAFSSQQTYDATAGVTIDFGDGKVERYRVATDVGRIAPFADTNGDGKIELLCDHGDSCDNNGDGVVDDQDRIIFNATGENVGRTMKDVLAMLGVDYTAKDVDYDKVAAKVLFSVNGIQNDPDNHQAWVLFVSKSAAGGVGNGQEVKDTDFDDIVLSAGTSYTLAYLQDKDEDELFAREEYLYGSQDTFKNSDDKGGSNDYNNDRPDSADGIDTSICTDRGGGQTGGYPFNYFQTHSSATLPLENPTYTCDALGDYFEVHTGWPVKVRGQTIYTARSSPRVTDTDADGLSDDMEYQLGTDPRKRDTDGDGITDFDEIYGFQERFRGDLAFGDVTDKFCPALITDKNATCDPNDTKVYVTNPLDPDTDGDGILDGFEIKLGANPQVADAADFIDTDHDGLSDTKEEQFGSSKYVPDTDGDGLPDLLEYMIGSNPQLADSDGDGLSDYDELDIKTFNTLPAVGSLNPADFNVDKFLKICGNLTYNATACNYEAPSGAGLPYGTNPATADTDGDGLSDPVELSASWSVQVADQDSYTVQPNPAQADKDHDDLNDSEEQAEGTDPNNHDTDGDGAPDGSDSEPLTPNTTVTFTYTQIRVDGDCDTGTGGSDAWYGNLTLIYPDHPSPGRDVYDLNNAAIDGVQEGDSGYPSSGSASVTFGLAKGQSFQPYASGVSEGDSTSDDDTLNDVDTTAYTYDDVSANGTGSDSGTIKDDQSDNCQLTVFWSWSTN